MYIKYKNSKLTALIKVLPLIIGFQMASANQDVYEHRFNYKVLEDAKLFTELGDERYHNPIFPSSDWVAVEFYCVNSSINTGYRNDFLEVNKLFQSELLAGPGDDFIKVGFETMDSKIFGDAGNDTIIVNNPVDLYLDAGTGDDKVTFFYSEVENGEVDLKSFKSSIIDLGEGDNDRLIINLNSTRFYVIDIVNENETRIYTGSRSGLYLFLTVKNHESIEFLDEVHTYENVEPSTTSCNRGGCVSTPTTQTPSAGRGRPAK